MAPLARSVALASAITVVAALPKPTAPPAKEFDKLIVGGEPAAAGDFPYIVSLQQGGSHFCGGSLLDATTVVTAAHCSTGTSPGSVSVVAGTLTWSSPGVEAGVSDIIIHPSYSSSSLDNDIAIWKLSEPIEGSGITYASLPSAGSDPAAGSDLTVAGWGTTTEGGSIPEDLLKVTVPVVGRDACNSAYGAGQITDAMFCAGFDEGGKDACQGDSGGPIRDDASGALVGVVSWGQGCAQAGYPGVYSNIGALLDFVESNL